MSNFIKKAYDRLEKMPAGRFLFSRFVGFAAPYSGSIWPNIEELRDGYARVTMHDRRMLRNHLKSIHAIAMVNLAELTTGLAINYGLPDNARGILTGLSIEYKKKARGTLVAECHCDHVRQNIKAEYDVAAEIRDANNDVVATAKAKWLIGPQSHTKNR